MSVRYLLDTNMLTEGTKPRPDPNAAAWLAQLDEDRAYVSVATFAEIRHGIERMPAGQRRQYLTTWLDVDLVDRFAGRVLAIDRQVADAWGVAMARIELMGATIGAMDVFIGATAEVHGLTIATRNMRDFARLGVAVFDPWTYRP